MAPYSQPSGASRMLSGDRPYHSSSRRMRHFIVLDATRTASRMTCHLRAGIRVDGKLQLVQIRVIAAAREQFAVTSLLHHATVIHHHDEIGVLDGREAVRDHKRGAVAHHLGERGLDVTFRLAVQRRRGLVLFLFWCFFCFVCVIARRWRWPPDSSMPFSPTSVSRPSGRRRMNSIACAASAARTIASSLTSPSAP